MAEPFGKKTKSSSERGKRPAPTIDGTATEVKVEEPGVAASAEDSPQGDGEAPPPGDEPKTPPPPRPSRVGPTVSHLAAGLVGGLAGVAALLLWGGLDLGGTKTVAPKLDAVEQRLAKLETAPAPADPGEVLDTLEARIDALETRAPETPDLSALTDRLAKTEAELKTLAETERRLNAKLDAAIAKEGDANASAVQALQDQIADLRTRLGALAEAGLIAEQAELGPEIDALNARVAKLESVIPGVAEAVSKETEEAKAAALAIAFANLRAAVSDGQPYVAAFDTLKTLSPGATDLTVLAAHAKDGIPTQAALVQAFAAAKSEALLEPPPESDGSFLGDLMRSAQSLVTIRRLDAPASGEGPAAVLARAEADLGQGKLAESVKQIETLEGAPRGAFSAWLNLARLRLKAEEELQRLEGRLLVSVGGGAPSGPRTE